MGSRRQFLGQAAGAITAAPWVSAAEKAEPLQIALIGCGGMGQGHLKLLAPRKDIRIA